MVRPRLLVSPVTSISAGRARHCARLAVLLSAEQAHPVPDQPTVTSAGTKARG